MMQVSECAPVHKGPFGKARFNHSAEEHVRPNLPFTLYLYQSQYKASDSAPRLAPGRLKLAGFVMAGLS